MSDHVAQVPRVKATNSFQQAKSDAATSSKIRGRGDGNLSRFNEAAAKPSASLYRGSGLNTAGIQSSRPTNFGHGLPMIDANNRRVYSISPDKTLPAGANVIRSEASSTLHHHDAHSHKSQNLDSELTSPLQMVDAVDLPPQEMYDVSRISQGRLQRKQGRVVVDAISSHGDRTTSVHARHSKSNKEPLASPQVNSLRRKNTPARSVMQAQIYSGSEMAEVPKLDMKSPSIRSESGRTLDVSRQSSSGSSPIRPTRHVSQAGRPPFNTYNQSFGLNKSISADGGSLLKAVTSPHKSATPSRTRADFSASVDTMRLQSSLLNYHFLHTSAATNLCNYTSSARDHLHETFVSLQDIYKTVILPLERQSRQRANCRALHAWSGGNTIGLKRKLTVLVEVLGKLVALTAAPPTPLLSPVATLHRSDAAEKLMTASEADQSDTHPEGQGAYSRLVEHFEAWIGWVEGIWTERDLDMGLIGTKSAIGTTLPPPSPTFNMRGLDERETTTMFRAIDGLGDGMKLELRAIANMLNALAARLEDAKGLAFSLESSKGHATVNIDGTVDAAPPSEPVAHLSEKTTPEVIYALTCELLAGMQEEIQLMRELECEVMLGEEAWVGRRLKEIREGVLPPRQLARTNE